MSSPAGAEPSGGAPPGPGALWIVIPALNEAAAIAGVVEALPRGPSTRIIVADNGSTDETGVLAQRAGAIVVHEPRRGYGRACLAALAEVRRQGAQPQDCVVFLDADASDDPSDLPAIAGPVQAGRADLVIGSRVRGRHEPGALLPQARWGNWLATRWIARSTGVRFTDLGPFRAIAWGRLEQLDMREPTYGWTVEMQWKAATAGLRCLEVPAAYRRRIGRSKITGTVRGTILASSTILSILVRSSVRRDRRDAQASISRA